MPPNVKSNKSQIQVKSWHLTPEPLKRISNIEQGTPNVEVKGKERPLTNKWTFRFQPWIPNPDPAGGGKTKIRGSNHIALKYLLIENEQFLQR